MLIYAICLKIIDIRFENLPELNSLCPASKDCTDFVYTNTTNIDPLLANLNSFFSKKESRPLTIKAFDAVDALQTYWKQNNVAVGLNVLEFNGTNLKYNIHVNNTIFQTDYIQAGYVSTQAYVDFAFLNIFRKNNSLKLLNSPLSYSSTNGIRFASSSGTASSSILPIVP